MKAVHLANIDLNLLVVFDALVAEGHATRAAERIGLTQPAVSHALNRLRALFGEPVSKHVLIHGVWPRLAIEDSNLNVQIAALRRILEALAGSSHWIETLPRRGYCFVGPLVVRDDALNEVKK
jgi:DNA-binding winged helix-turn-helix (wHTH) protein